MTPDVITRAGRMLDNGMTRKQVAVEIGVGLATVYSYFPVTVKKESPK